MVLDSFDYGGVLFCARGTVGLVYRIAVRFVQLQFLFQRGHREPLPCSGANSPGCEFAGCSVRICASCRCQAACGGPNPKAAKGRPTGLSPLLPAFRGCEKQVRGRTAHGLSNRNKRRRPAGPQRTPCSLTPKRQHHHLRPVKQTKSPAGVPQPSGNKTFPPLAS